MLELYKNIRDRRIMLDMSQDELAKRTGYTSRASISRIEKGEIDLPQSKIVAFAKALDTTPGELMGWDEPDPVVEMENGWTKVSAKDLGKYIDVKKIDSRGVIYGKMKKQNDTLFNKLQKYVDKLAQLDIDDLDEVDQIIDMKLAKPKYNQ